MPFHADKDEIEALKDHYRAGGLGDDKIKKLSDLDAERPDPADKREAGPCFLQTRTDYSIS